MMLTYSVAVAPMNDRFDEEFKVEEDESKAARSDTPNNPVLLDWETREGLPADEYNHLGWLHPADYTFPSYDCVAQEYNADMFKGCEFCLASYAVSHHAEHMRLYHPDKIQWERMVVPPVSTHETNENYHTLKAMAVAPVDARETDENCLAPTNIPVAPVDAHETDENYHALTNQHSTRRRHSATEEMMERLGPRPSLDALRLMAKSPLSTERQLGQRLLEQRGRKDSNKWGRGPALKAPEPPRLMPSRLSDVSFLHVDLRAPLRERNEEDNKAATNPREQDHPLRRVTITRSGEGGATRVVIRRQSKSHVVVSLPLNPLRAD